MAILKWIVTLPFIVGAVLFALAHPDKVEVTLNPMSEPVELPLYFVSFLFLGVGFILGMIVTWFSMGSLRHTKRAQKKEIKELKKKNEALEEEKLELIKKYDFSEQPKVFDAIEADA